MYKGDRYLLCGPLDDSSDFQYWNTTKGWTCREEATLFSFEETKNFEMPSKSLGWIKYQNLGYNHDF
jgi:hypothetical protein